MALRIAIVGPGRVGMALAHGFAEAGATMMGLLGRDPERTKQRVATLGVGRVLALTDLLTAHVVVFAVGDADLHAAIGAAVAARVGRRCSLWLHVSGRHGPEVFAPAADLSVRIGSLHPLLPFTSAVHQSGPAQVPLRGALALVAGEPSSMRLLVRLCDLLGLRPIASHGAQNRTLYHAACALAANGTTALFDLARELVLRAGGGVVGKDADEICAALMHAATSAAASEGAAPALSGPVRRGDAATVAAHLEAMREHGEHTVPTYLALMRGALALARKQGLSEVACEQVAAVLSSHGAASGLQSPRPGSPGSGSSSGRSVS